MRRFAGFLIVISALFVSADALAQPALEPLLSPPKQDAIAISPEEMGETPADPTAPAEEPKAPDAKIIQVEPAVDEKAPPGEEPVDGAHFSAVQLQGLNKVTARISTFESPLGIMRRFGNLEIVALVCWQAPQEEKPENAALLKIYELKPGEAPTQIFFGWMFSSSPAISALEHPVYDITVLGCMSGDDPDHIE